MKLRPKKKPPVRSVRQRLDTPRQVPPAYSYHAQRAERAEAGGRQQSSVSQQRHRLLTARYWARRSGLVIVLLVTVFSVISVLHLSDKPRIVLLDANSNKYAFHNAQQYQAAATEQLSSSLWNRNKITIDTGNSATVLQQKYPELATVTITLPLIGHKPIYYLTANRPAFVLQAVNGTYVLDTSGMTLIAKDAAPATADGLPVLADQTGIQANVGKSAISRPEAVFIQTIIDTFAAKQITVTSLVLPANAAQELDVQISGVTHTIKFNTREGSARQQVGTYLATMNTLKGQNVMPVQYVDVRVAGRAYYQ